jgi:hypothetical protein
MTVYKAIKQPEAYAAADLAYAIIKGEHPKMTDTSTTATWTSLQASDPGRGDQGQHHGHRREGRLPQRL